MTESFKSIDDISDLNVPDFVVVSRKDNNNNNQNLLNEELERVIADINEENSNYSVFSDPHLTNCVNDSLDIFLAFDSCHQGKKSDPYRYKDISIKWAVIAEVYRDVDIAKKVESKVRSVLNSFSKTQDKLSIRKLSVNEIDELFTIAAKYYDPYTPSDIGDIGAYLATVVRSMIA